MSLCMGLFLLNHSRGVGNKIAALSCNAAQRFEIARLLTNLQRELEILGRGRWWQIFERRCDRFRVAAEAQQQLDKHARRHRVTGPADFRSKVCDRLVESFPGERP